MNPLNGGWAMAPHIIWLMWNPSSPGGGGESGIEEVRTHG